MSLICEEQIQPGTESPNGLPKTRKRWIRRVQKDHSQHLRHGLQGLFLALNVWIGVEFVLFVGIVGYAKWSGHWQTDVSHEIYFRLVPRAQELGHP